MAATELLPGTSLGEDGRYHLQQMLGTGGMASVWLAQDERLGRQVAVKVLSDTLALDGAYVSRFEREARVAARLSHPNLVNIFDFSAAPPRPYLAMEYIPGASLADLLHGRARGAWDPESVFRQLIGALAHVHAAGIIHRDIKPGNVLVGSDGRTRLTDFGIARPSDTERLTNTGLVIGTARYIAPEIMRGEKPDERSDLYSCGVLLRDCLGGRRSRLQQVADRLASEDPSKRPTSAAAVIELLDGSPTAPTGALSSISTFRTRPRLPRPAIALAALVLAVLLIVISSSSGGSRRVSPPPSLPSAGAPLTRQLSYLDQVISRAQR